MSVLEKYKQLVVNRPKMTAKNPAEPQILIKITAFKLKIGTQIGLHA